MSLNIDTQNNEEDTRDFDTVSLPLTEVHPNSKGIKKKIKPVLSAAAVLLCLFIAIHLKVIKLPREKEMEMHLIKSHADSLINSHNYYVALFFIDSCAQVFPTCTFLPELRTKALIRRRMKVRDILKKSAMVYNNGKTKKAKELIESIFVFYPASHEALKALEALEKNEIKKNIEKKRIVKISKKRPEKSNLPKKKHKPMSSGKIKTYKTSLSKSFSEKDSLSEDNRKRASLAQKLYSESLSLELDAGNIEKARRLWEMIIKLLPDSLSTLHRKSKIKLRKYR
ncbi:MAG: hypothetical protein ACLFQK_05065 [Fibrobacterota bacterium]